MAKHIYIYSPSGAVRDKAAFRRGIRVLEKCGYEVELDPDALTSYQRFAGDDATRIAAIGRAASSGADVALITRGGYGLTRILGQLPTKEIVKAIERGTQFVGMSDFTAFQLALLAHAGAKTWAGPALCEGFGVAETEPDEIMQSCFEDMVLGQGEGTGWRQLKPRSSEPYLLPEHWRAANGMIWGGNLSIVVSLLGTPYFPKVKGGFLFLEDIGEHPYRIERMLTQLLHAGVLSKQKAILLGQFTGYKLSPHDKGFDLSAVATWLRQQLNIPVITNLPYGHVQTKILLPVGARAELVTEGRDALLFWG